MRGEYRGPLTLAFSSSGDSKIVVVDRPSVTLHTAEMLDMSV